MKKNFSEKRWLIGNLFLLAMILNLGWKNKTSLAYKSGINYERTSIHQEIYLTDTAKVKDEIKNEIQTVDSNKPPQNTIINSVENQITVLPKRSRFNISKSGAILSLKQ